MNDIKFSKKDMDQISRHGLTTDSIRQQTEMLRKGFPPLDLVAPASVGDGIISFNDPTIDNYLTDYEKHIADKKLLKFVPASGVASRMFKDLLELKNKGFPEEEIREALKQETDMHSKFSFFKHFQDFAFFNEFNDMLKNNGLDLKKLSYHELLEYFLDEKGLNYAERPKALIQFHKYNDHTRTALEEHLVEGALYARNSDNSCHIHFTLSPEHIEKTQSLLKEVLPHYEKQFDIQYSIEHSIQNPSSDTIALSPDNQLFRNKDSSLLFRPGGHGALLENLNNLDADIVFIKNIDNIVPDHFKGETIRYKKLLAIQLILIQDQIFDFLKRLDANEVSPSFTNEILDFCQNKLFIKFPEDFRDLELIEQLDMLFEFLNRPLRICGMVKNEGEPGGGPYWVRNNNDVITLQIVEASQINLNDPEQNKIMKNASHFNPVDLVCGLKDFKGKKFDLMEFTDPDTGFIALKSKEGKELKALEHPGLWNGAMADWNTIFVEVPLITFNPVKTINDLLRKEHMNPK